MFFSQHARRRRRPRAPHRPRWQRRPQAPHLAELSTRSSAEAALTPPRSRRRRHPPRSSSPLSTEAWQGTSPRLSAEAALGLPHARRRPSCSASTAATSLLLDLVDSCRLVAAWRSPPCVALLLVRAWRRPSWGVPPPSAMDDSPLLPRSSAAACRFRRQCDGFREGTSGLEASTREQRDKREGCR